MSVVKLARQLKRETSAVRSAFEDERKRMRVKRELWRTTMALVRSAVRSVASARSAVRLATSARLAREKKWQAKRKELKREKR